MNDNIIMLQTIERYLDGTMLPDEKIYFEQIRKNSPEIDQMVVEHSLFIKQLENYSSTIDLKENLSDIHEKLLNSGEIAASGKVISFKSSVFQIYHRYKRDIAIAASVGGAIALVISGLFTYFSPVFSNNRLQQLSIEFDAMKRKQQVQTSIINEVKSKIPKNVSLISGGTGFLVDTKGFIVTNAHVLKGNSAIVLDNDGHELNADIVYIDTQKDLAILKINDEDYKPLKSIPYSISTTIVDLSEEIFTLGFPKNDITYTQGYLSSKTGLNGDTSTYQIQMNSNPGSSGGPVFNKNAELIGVLSSRQIQADGVTFAIKSKNLFTLIEDLKKEDTSIQKIQMPATSLIKGKERKVQVRRIEEYIFSIRAYNKSK